VYYVGVTLDGYIAGPDHEVEFFPVPDELVAWINARYPETIPTHIRNQVGLPAAENLAFDTLIMGRSTYEPALSVGITSPYAHLRQYVVSTTLDVDDPAVTTSTDPIGLVKALKAEDGLDIWLCGGGKLAGALLEEIDELIIKRYPVVAGAGIPAFGGEFRPRPFSLTTSEQFDNGTVVSWLTRTD